VRRFYKYNLWAKMLCIGERVKKGTFKPCITTIPCSTISEALNANLNREDIFALGFLNDDYLLEIDKKRQIMTTAPKDTILLVAKLPLTTEYLIDVKAEIFIEERDGLKEILKDYPSFQMGALKSKGLGNCEVSFDRTLSENETEIIEGRLRTRIYKDKETFERLGIEDVIKPLYGYLYKRTSPIRGYYQLSLFEGSILRGPRFIMEEVKK